MLDASLDNAQQASQGRPGSKAFISCHANLSADAVLARLLLYTTSQGNMSA